MLSFLVKEVQRTPASSSSSPSLSSFDDQIPAPLRAAIRNRKNCTEMQPLKPSKELEHEISTRLLHFAPQHCSHYHESVYRQQPLRLQHQHDGTKPGLSLLLKSSRAMHRNETKTKENPVNKLFHTRSFL